MNADRKMNTEDIDRLNEELLLELRHSADESDRGLVIFSAGQVDFHLRKILEAFLVKTTMVNNLFDDAFAPLSSLSGKTRMAFVLGLITKSEMKRIDAVRKVRNVFAHEMKADFEHPDVRKLCSKEPIYDGRLCDRDAFLHLAMNLVPPLMYRRLEVQQLVERSDDRL